ncbi:hypothetical protein IT575_05205 [bacterium]|nr:hypothetical protein [bacterium]
MLVDELQIECIGGKGGNGSVHFARRKYQPFGGPDGGDGGNGGSVLLVGHRDTDTLQELRAHKRRYGPFLAEPGKPGGENLMIGAVGRDNELPVPLGTLAFETDTGREIGHVRASGERLLAAKGGRGGRGNPKFATGQLRAPKHAEDGRPGEERNIDLLYRIFADTTLMEPLYASRGALLPAVAKRHSDKLDYELYLRRPRWLRIEHEYQLYDVSFLPLLCSGLLSGEDAELAELQALIQAEEAMARGEFDPDSQEAPQQDGDDPHSAADLLDVPHLTHLFWPVNAVVNLLPLGSRAAEAWELLHARLLDVPLRRLRRMVVLSEQELFGAWGLETEEAQAEILSLGLGSGAGQAEALAHFYAELTGGVVV